MGQNNCPSGFKVSHPPIVKLQNSADQTQPGVLFEERIVSTVNLQNSDMNQSHGGTSVLLSQCIKKIILSVQNYSGTHPKGFHDCGGSSGQVRSIDVK